MFDVQLQATASKQQQLARPQASAERTIAAAAAADAQAQLDEAQRVAALAQMEVRQRLCPCGPQHLLARPGALVGHNTLAPVPL